MLQNIKSNKAFVLLKIYLKKSSFGSTFRNTLTKKTDLKVCDMIGKTI